jgi:hypothetical protein
MYLLREFSVHSRKLRTQVRYGNYYKNLQILQNFQLGKKKANHFGLEFTSVTLSTTLKIVLEGILQFFMST